MSNDRWPELTLTDWADTRDTVHLWTQIVGKVRLGLEPMTNHWWQVPLYVTSRGLTTSLMHSGERGVEIEFDFVDHSLDIRLTTGDRRRVALEPKSVARFYEETTEALRELEVVVAIVGTPNEVPDAIPFERDETHRSYDDDAARRYWLALVQIDRLLTVFRSRFVGKASPVHVFWGGNDICTTRFSGRDAPKHRGGVPNCPDFVQELAYSHEVSSCGFWPDGSSEGSFYSYAYPEPDGFANWSVEPSAAYYDPELGEFLLPYEKVRTSPTPDDDVLSFLQSTYEAAADLAAWDRDSLEWSR